MRRILTFRTAVFITFLLILLLGRRAITTYTDYLWFASLGYEQVLVRRWMLQALVGLVAGLVSFAFVFTNILFARRIVTFEPSSVSGYMSMSPLFRTACKVGQRITQATSLVALAVGIAAGAASSTHWLECAAAAKAVPAGSVDPLFGKDISFFLFRLPFFVSAWKLAFSLVIVSLVLVAFVYGVSVVVLLTSRKSQLPAQILKHFAVLFALLMGLAAWYFSLQSLDLLFTQKSSFYGAGYSETHVLLPIYTVAMGLSVLTAVLFLFSLKAKVTKTAGIGVAAVLVLPVVGRLMLAPAMQKLMVTSNEIRLEKPYIRNNIQATLRAFDLESVETRQFEVADQLTAGKLKEHAAAVTNVRLWDHRPLRDTYQQMQEIRSYYRFTDVDLDRYWINGEYRQVALAPRELDVSRLSTSAQNWTNLHLKYTHGYGICLSPVNETTSNGLPRFLVENIPPVSHVPLPITRPEIYYGEAQSPYIMTNTNQREFDYPVAGKRNATCSYQSRTGIPIGSLFRRIAFAVRLNDWKIPLYRGVGRESQILIRRNLLERVRALAPFLKYDGDPYIVVANGGLHWILDAYTTSRSFPYAAPTADGTNYLRNSVKVVINAYDGTTRFYVYRADDPIILTYRRIFPELFSDIKDLPKELDQHLRYPADLLKLQSEVFALYHMTDPETFYSKEDPWRIGHEIFESRGNERPMDPYYMIMRMPEGKTRVGQTVDRRTPPQEEFVLMAPFTPQHRQNMIAWICARCDAPNRGKLMVYQLRKGENVAGPMQIEAMIDQDTEISKLMTLWGEAGSSVIRGNLILLPIENSLLYIKPIYLKASATPLPELKQVIVAYNQQVVMTKSLPDSLAALFGATSAPTEAVAAAAPEARKAAETPGGPGQLQPLTHQALERYREAEDAVKSGNWKEYGEAMKQLEETLVRLKELP